MPLKINSVKVLISRDHKRGYRGVLVKWTNVTTVEGASSDSKHLYPMIVGLHQLIKLNRLHNPLLDGIMRSLRVDAPTYISACNGLSLCLIP